jgi:hypothetical protein
VGPAPVLPEPSKPPPVAVQQLIDEASPKLTALLTTIVDAQEKVKEMEANPISLDTTVPIPTTVAQAPKRKPHNLDAGGSLPANFCASEQRTLETAHRAYLVALNSAFLSLKRRQAVALTKIFEAEVDATRAFISDLYVHPLLSE